MTMINSYSADPGAALDSTLGRLIDRRERLLGPAYRLFYRRPLHIVRGRGVHLYDAAGREYLDAYNNVACVGHCHPEVVEAIAEQAAALNTHTRYLHEGILDYAERLLATFPASLGHVMFTCSGSESNDLALRIARKYTGGTGFIVTSLAYHGGTVAVAELSPSLLGGVPLGTHVRTVPAPNPYRDGAEVGQRFTDAVRGAIRSLVASGVKLAGLIVDTVFSSDGIIADPRGSIRGAVEAVHEAGGLFIADEVQAGFGRTGESFWGFRPHGVQPDMVSLGKPMGAGHPVAALVLRPEVADRFGSDCRYFNTFGGNAVSIAAADAVLRIIERERLAQHAESVGEYLRARLRMLAERYAIIGDIRGAGLFIGVELVTDRSTKAAATQATSEVVNGLRDRGVLISACGPGANVLKIRPPLVFEPAHADLLVQRLDEVLAELPTSAIPTAKP
jgi:4-aminobutyrate aminotransferase-like enzyme